jgi:hypothetical protein
MHDEWWCIARSSGVDLLIPRPDEHLHVIGVDIVWRDDVRTTTSRSFSDSILRQCSDHLLAVPIRVTFDCSTVRGRRRREISTGAVWIFLKIVVIELMSSPHDRSHHDWHNSIFQSQPNLFLILEDDSFPFLKKRPSCFKDWRAIVANCPDHVTEDIPGEGE